MQHIWLFQRLSWFQNQFSKMGITDIVEIILLSFLVYTVLVWIRDTRAWTLLKGIITVVLLIGLIYILEMDTLIFLIRKGFNLLIIGVIVIFQPELRHALEHLGEKLYLLNLLDLGMEKDVEERCSDKTVQQLVRAAVAMGEAKTGALIVLERNETLADWQKTGISLNAEVSAELLINIFEHNTPLHDGAVLIKGDTILSATCYLPLSESLALSKELGTRHRAAVGISEVTDSLTIVVSEETGKISLAHRGQLIRNVKEEKLKAELVVFQNKKTVEKKNILFSLGSLGRYLDKIKGDSSK